MGFHLPKGFVCRSEPADVAAGTEEDKPEDGQTKIDPVASSDPPRQARNYIHYQRDAVNCKEGRGKNVRLCSFISSHKEETNTRYYNRKGPRCSGKLKPNNAATPSKSQVPAWPQGPAAQTHPSPEGPLQQRDEEPLLGPAKGWRAA